MHTFSLTGSPVKPFSPSVLFMICPWLRQQGRPGIYWLSAGKPLLIHAGDPRYDFSHPRRIAHLASLFPDTLIIAAHFGGWSQWPEAIEYLADLPNVVVDTSSTLGFLQPAEIRRLIDSFGTHRIVFGSDYPMWTPAGELQRLDRIALTKQEKRAILWENGARLLKLI